MRTLAVVFSVLLLAGLAIHAAGASEIPRGAWERAIGDVPAGTQGGCPNRGIVLGGFGAGAFMYNISGSFGPWVDNVGSYANFWLREAAFHVYEKKGAQTTVKCLSADTVMMSAWSRLQVGDGTYYALQPKG